LKLNIDLGCRGSLRLHIWPVEEDFSTCLPVPIRAQQALNVIEMIRQMTVGESVEWVAPLSRGGGYTLDVSILQPLVGCTEQGVTHDPRVAAVAEETNNATVF